MRGMAVFVYSAQTVDAIGRILVMDRPSVDGTLLTSVMDQTFVENRDFIHHLRSTPPLVLIVYSRLDRSIQSATEMLHIVLTAPSRLSDMHLADALV